MNKKEDMTARGRQYYKTGFLKEIWTDLHGKRDFLQHKTIQRLGFRESPPRREKEKENSGEEGTKDGFTCRSEMLKQQVRKFLDQKEQERIHRLGSYNCKTLPDQ